MERTQFRVYDPNTDRLDYEFDFNIEEKQKLHDALNRCSTFTLDDLRQVALWKINRVLEIPETILEKLRDVAHKGRLDIESNEVKILISDLLSCQGVGMPMASTILKFIRPDIFPIIDVRAYRALTGEKIGSRSYTIDIYIRYAKRIAEISEETSIIFHEVDEQLYCFDVEHNKTI